MSAQMCSDCCANRHGNCPVNSWDNEHDTMGMCPCYEAGHIVALMPNYPPPPENVRVLCSSGREVAVECVYVGTEDDVFVWEAIVPAGLLVIGVKVDALPGRTSVVGRLAT